MTAEPLRRSPIAHVNLPAGGRVRLREVPLLTHINLRIDPTTDAARRIADELGAPLPVDPNTVAIAADRSVLWLGPDEYQIVGPDGDASIIEELLCDALSGEHGSVVDLSANHTTLELSGQAAHQVLDKGCSIDLHPRAFTPGRCAQTLLARVHIVLWHVAPNNYRLLVRPSFAAYVTEWLIDALQEFAS